MTDWKIDALQLPDSGASIGLCGCPGQSGPLSKDLRQLRDWGAVGLVTLIEDHEFQRLGVTSLSRQLEALGIRWWHLPIRDMDIPDESFEARWQSTGHELRTLLNDGCSIALHCHGGKGRTGTIAARLLVELGSTPALAIDQVRRVRPGSIETAGQETYVHGCTVV